MLFVCRRSLSGSELCRIQTTAVDSGSDLAQPGAAVQAVAILPDPDPGKPESPDIRAGEAGTHTLLALCFLVSR